MLHRILYVVFVSSSFAHECYSQVPEHVTITSPGVGWASNSINTVVFRKNSLVTWRDTQFVAYYDAQKYVVLAKRKHGTTNWTVKKTAYQGNADDAHNSISIMTDGEGYLHMAWDHHNNPLRYCRSIHPGSLDLTLMMTMTGHEEKVVSYPEFHKLNNGDLLFLYRSGESGNGNLIINRYSVKNKKWSVLQNNLINGEGERNAYWQAHVDTHGTIHISWVWRETWDVSTNHDLCYARSSDGGDTWETSVGKKYDLPITVKTAEYACRIFQQRELINQTSMVADENGNPIIATYWREEDSKIPQYHLVYKDARGWQKVSLNFRSTPFSLFGGGTKQIPVSRPQILFGGGDKKNFLLLVFRDLERGSKVSVAIIDRLRDMHWEIINLTGQSVGSWEPTYDTERWTTNSELHLFLQNVTQVDGEGKANSEPQPVQILEWKPDW
jgi:hypothetical protein